MLLTADFQRLAFADLIRLSGKWIPYPGYPGADPIWIEADVLKNPSKSDLEGWIKQGKDIRGIRIEGDYFFWKGDSHSPMMATHDAVLDGLQKVFEVPKESNYDLDTGWFYGRQLRKTWEWEAPGPPPFMREARKAFQKVFKFSTAPGAPEFTMMVNPSFSDLKGWADQGHAIRGIQTHTGDFYFWRAHDAVHQFVIRRMVELKMIVVVPSHDDQYYGKVWDDRYGFEWLGEDPPFLKGEQLIPGPLKKRTAFSRVIKLDYKSWWDKEWRQVHVTQDPTPEEIDKMLQNSTSAEIRGLLIQGHYYFWTQDDALHDDVELALAQENITDRDIPRTESYMRMIEDGQIHWDDWVEPWQGKENEAYV